MVREVDEGEFLKRPPAYCFLDNGDRCDETGWQKSDEDTGRACRAAFEDDILKLRPQRPVGVSC